MKFIFRTLYNDLFRSFISVEFVLATLGVCIVYYLGIWSELQFAPDILYLFKYANEASTFYIIFVLVSILPYTTSFCSEWNNQYIKPLVIRTGIRWYTFSKIFTCMLSAGCSYVFGMMIFIISLKTKLPVIAVNSDSFSSYSKTLGGELLMDRRYFLYFVIYCILGFLTAALWSTVGLYASSYLPNKFIALFTPFIAYYVLNLFTNKFPIWLRLNRIGQGRCIIGGTATSLGYAILLLDEPMNGIDKHGIIEIRELLLKLRDEGKTIILSSHSAEDIDILCDTVSEMDEGILEVIRSDAKV